ncbi:MAG: ATP-dependent zinc metalloprotease FtsH, partial [Clostridia bacterium]|nr:ATP-dependent zinc metalloprotease FtsH [Clostridia bacterium]
MKKSGAAFRVYAIVLFVLLLVAVSFQLQPSGNENKQITYPELLKLIEEDKVAQVAIREDTLYGLRRDSSVPSILFPSGNYDFEAVIGDDFLLTVRQMTAGANDLALDSVSVADLPFTLTYLSSERPWYIEYLPLLLEVVIFGIFFYYMFRSKGGMNRMMGFGKMDNVEVSQQGKKSKITFADVAGSVEEKAELEEMVDFLRSPKTYTALGARIPKGVLLVGPPGTGKTLLAKAVAGEANVPFFSISGSDFVEMYVGVGASRVRDLFAQAKQAAPAIVFIDEIDAVGRKRGAGLGGGHDEREQTLNQLLVEMDGFAVNEGVIVMAATNRKDILDPALLRPGRFDRQVTVNYPDLDGRVAILKVHARGKPLDDDVDLMNLAKRMPYGTGADLENVMNEAAILTARARREKIDQQTLIDAIARVQMGPEKKSHKVSEHDRRMVAVHESGHAVIGHLLSGCDEVHLVTIVPRGMSAGHTLSLPSEERDNMSRTAMLHTVTMA